MFDSYVNLPEGTSKGTFPQYVEASSSEYHAKGWM